MKKDAFNIKYRNYDLYRPSYPIEIYDYICKYIVLNESSTLLEIGVGTGQATLPFLKKGYKITAIEYGDNLANLTKSKFNSYNNLEVINIPFENYSTNMKFDLIYSASAFHWIEQPYGYEKAISLLEEEGLLVLFWNRPMIVEPNNIKFELDEVYSEILGWKFNLIPLAERVSSNLSEFKEHHLNVINNKIFTNPMKRKFNSVSYIGLLETYSDHITLDSVKKKKLYSKISAIIDKNNDAIVIQDMVDVYIIRK